MNNRELSNAFTTITETLQSITQESYRDCQVAEVAHIVSRQLQAGAQAQVEYEKLSRKITTALGEKYQTGTQPDSRSTGKQLEDLIRLAQDSLEPNKLLNSAQNTIAELDTTFPGGLSYTDPEKITHATVLVGSVLGDKELENKLRGEFYKAITQQAKERTAYHAQRMSQYILEYVAFHDPQLLTSIQAAQRYLQIAQEFGVDTTADQALLQEKVTLYFKSSQGEKLDILSMVYSIATPDMKQQLNPTLAPIIERSRTKILELEQQTGVDLSGLRQEIQDTYAAVFKQPEPTSIQAESILTEPEQTHVGEAK